MRDEILDYLIKSKFVESYTKKLVYPSDKDNLQDDYISEVWLQLCEIKEEKWNELYQQGKFAISGYVTGIIKQQLWSDTSRIYTKYYKHYNKEITKDEDFWMAYSEEH